MARPRLSIEGLTKETARETGRTYAETRVMVEGLINVIGNALLAGEAVNLSGICTLTTIERAARKGRNPQTGETIDVPAKRALKCKPSRDLYAGL